MVHTLFPEISSWQRSARDRGFLSVAFWQNPGAQLCVALHCCLDFSRRYIRNIRNQHHRSFETGSGPSEQVKEWTVVDRSYARVTWACRRGNNTLLDVPSHRTAVLVSSFPSLILCGGFPCSCPEDVGVAAAHPCDSPGFTLMYKNFSSAIPPPPNPNG